MSFVADLLKKITPPPVNNPEFYDGVEYKWKLLVFRPALFEIEPYLISVVAFYLLFFLYGKYTNSSKANAWYKAHVELFNSQFSRTTPKLISDGNSDFYSFSTGRRHVASLHTVFTLLPRHDFFQWAFMTLRSLVDLDYRPEDVVELDFKLSDEDAPGFVWGIVNKNLMKKVSQDRWDLTFTKTTENQQIPVAFSVMSEFADVTEAMLRPVGNFSLAEALKQPAFATYLRSLSITDQPRLRPASPLPLAKRSKHVILSLSLPSGSQASETKGLVTAVCQLIDNLNKVNIRPDTKTKLKKAREEVDKQLEEDATRDEKEERAQAAEDKKAAKRKLEEERIARLPAAEQQKILDRERKRSARKQQMKGAAKR